MQLVRMRAWVTVAALSLAVLYPLSRPRGWDDFPISSYPMFSRGDIGHVVPLGHAVLVEAGEAGEAGASRRTQPVPLALLGTPEPMVAKSIVENAIAKGTAADLCRALAARIAAEDVARALPPAPRAVEIVTSTFDTRAYFAEGGRRPMRREVHARCEIGR